MKIVPTWKKAASRRSRTAETQILLSTNLIGGSELTDGDLEGVHGGNAGILTGNLNNNHINVLNGHNSILNNVGILGVGNSGCSSDSSCNPGSDYRYEHQC